MQSLPATTPDLRACFARDGYVFARKVIDQELIAEARAHIAWLLRRHPQVRPEQLRTNLVVDDPFWVRLVADDRLLDIAEQFIGPDIALFGSQYIAKPPRDGQAVLWHQDGSYWPLEPKVATSLWLALDDSLPENGCMRVIPGSHRSALQAIHARADVANALASGMDPRLVDEAQAVDVTLAPGDVSIHHPQLIHGSNANTSDRWRRALTIRYIPTSTRILVPSSMGEQAGSRSSPFLLRGTAVPGVNAYLARPRFRPQDHMDFRGSSAWAAPA
jgi:phytanoyl-CoA hydroxylase